MSLHTIYETLIPPTNITEWLVARGLTPTEDPKANIGTLILKSNVRTQEDVAALTINLTKGSVDGPTLTKVLQAAFPRAKVGDRHGPYYLSHARTGKLPVDYIPGKRNSAPTPAPAKDLVLTEGPRVINIQVPPVDPNPELVTRISELTEALAEAHALIDLIRGAKSIKDVRALLADQDEVPATETTEA